jgi:hypothetical protein
LRAWPPSSIVATQVVRSCELYRGSVASVATALSSPGFATTAFMAVAIAGSANAADLSK